MRSRIVSGARPQDTYGKYWKKFKLSCTALNRALQSNPINTFGNATFPIELSCVMLPSTELHWLNEPRWADDGQTLTMTTAPHTDFWRETHYGFIRDSGHFVYSATQEEFTAQVKIQGSYRSLYDQAGLMLRSSETQWVKAGVEFVGHQQLSTVVTQPYSDWNVRPVGTPTSVELKMTRKGNALSVQTRLPEEDWQLLRLAFWPPALPMLIGLYACSPGDVGFDVCFSDFDVRVADAGPLY